MFVPSSSSYAGALTIAHEPDGSIVIRHGYGDGFQPSAYSGHGDATTPKQREALAKAATGNPAKLWSTNPKSRPISWVGIATILLGVPSDAILTIADGARPGPGFLEGEMRKSILGGLVAMEQAGVEGIHTKGLKAPLVGNGKADDPANAALAKAAGMPRKDLAHVYAAVVKRVAHFGPAMRALAWSHRVELWLVDVAGIEKVHAISGAVVALFVPIGTAVGAAIGGHSAITMSIAKKIGAAADHTIKHALPKAKAEAAHHHKHGKGRRGPGAHGGGELARPSALDGMPMGAWLALGALAVGGGAWWWTQREDA